MKFKTQTSVLKEVVSSVSRAVNPRPSTPALTGLYIHTSDGFLEEQKDNKTDKESTNLFY